MPHSIFFNGGFAIHGSYEVGRLGRPASHGCIRLHPSNAAALYALVKQHGSGDTTIRVTGSIPAPPMIARARSAPRVVARASSAGRAVMRMTSPRYAPPQVIVRQVDPYAWGYYPSPPASYGYGYRYW
jgi:hypothetical protein